MVCEEDLGKREVPLEGSKPVPLCSQLCSRGPATFQGPPPCLHKSDRSREGCGCMLPSMCCVFVTEVPQEQRSNETFQRRYFQVCTKNSLGIAREPAHAGSAAFQPTVVKTQMASTCQSQLLYKQALLFMEMIWLFNRVENLAEYCWTPQQPHL